MFILSPPPPFSFGLICAGVLLFSFGPVCLYVDSLAGILSQRDHRYVVYQGELTPDEAGFSPWAFRAIWVPRKTSLATQIFSSFVFGTGQLLLLSPGHVPTLCTLLYHPVINCTFSASWGQVGESSSLVLKETDWLHARYHGRGRRNPLCELHFYTTVRCLSPMTNMANFLGIMSRDQKGDKHIQRNETRAEIPI